MEEKQIATNVSQKMPESFVALSDVDPTIIQEMRYAGSHNFVGRPIAGYVQPVCILTRQAALALKQAQVQVTSQGYSLKVYDCFRPQRAVDDFVAWAKDVEDQRMKTEFYPNVEKSQLFEQGYISTASSHSHGSTVDVTLVQLPSTLEPSTPHHIQPTHHGPENVLFSEVEMGTTFDFFDPLSHTDDPRITGKARSNRDLLRNIMKDSGFTNLALEWWHYTLNDEPFPDTFFDFLVTN